MKNYNFIFDKRQKILLEIANRKATNWILGLNRLPKNYKDIGFSGKIDKITPSSIQWKTGRMLKQSVKPKGGCFRKVLVPEWSGMFFTRPRFGEALVKKFYPVFLGIHFWDTLFANNFKPAWNLGFDEITLYPSPGNVSPCDGIVVRNNVNETFSTIRSGAGTVAYPTISINVCPSTHSSTINGQFYSLHRGIFNFDTSVLGLWTQISSGICALWIYGKGNQLNLSDAHAAIGIVKVSPNSTNTLIASDFNISRWTFDRLASDILYSNISVNNYNQLTLNQTGRNYINKTGITSIGLAFGVDIDAGTPNWNGSDYKTYASIRFADYEGTSYDPYLYLVYTSFNPHLARRKLMLGLR